MKKNLRFLCAFLTAIFLGGLHAATAAEQAAIFAPDAKLDRLATDMKFTEGPVWLPEKQMLIWSDIPASVQMQWTKNDGAKFLRNTAQSNGNMLDDEGRLVSCQHQGRNLVRFEDDGEVTVLIDRFEGKMLNSPNDLALHSDGSIWFTDPSYGLEGKPSDIGGQWVYRFEPSTGKIDAVNRSLDMPNGIAFSPDHTRLYISDMGTIGKILIYQTPAAGEICAEPVGEIDAVSDGMTVDQQGRLFTTTKDGVKIFDSNGKFLTVLAMPERPTNVCFGGDDGQTLFITAGKSLYSVRCLTPGVIHQR